MSAGLILETTMNQKNDQELTVQDNIVVAMDYVLNVDGELLEKTESNHPVEFIQGSGQIIPGLEREMSGMRIGDSKEVDVTPEDGYGVLDEDAYAEIPREEFPADIPVEQGVAILLRDEDGDEQEAHIIEIKENLVRLNLNHPLAGKDLHFEVKVVALREASEEEILHGHVHHN
jgi:FKBP-type peptidyl-prolyl cis-trans isomerase SlyD